jgi:hypothetical protein
MPRVGSDQPSRDAERSDGEVMMVAGSEVSECLPQCPCKGLMRHPPLDEDKMVALMIRVAKPAIRDYYQRRSLGLIPGDKPSIVGKMTFRIVRVTPAIATQWIHPSVDCYQHRSEISEKTVADLAEAILTRQFRLLSMEEPVAFDVHGRLCGGRHRLRAIIRARRPVWLLIMEDLIVRSPVFSRSYGGR